MCMLSALSSAKGELQFDTVNYTALSIIWFLNIVCWFNNLRLQREIEGIED